MMRLRTLYPVYSTGRAISHICLSLCEGMAGKDCDVEAWFPASSPEGRRPFSRDALPRWLKGLAYRLDPAGTWIRKRTEARFLRSLRPGDVAWIWPGASAGLYRAARERGALVVAERINCHRGTSRRILDEAFAKAGLAPTHGITEEAVRDETGKLLLADRVFVPSPRVAESVVEAGIPASRLLRSSYGWDPVRMSEEGPGLAATPEPTALFVGRGGIRKGLHLLLRAWARAGVRGRLAVVGTLDPELARLRSAELSRPDVEVVPFRDPVAPVYRSAQIFLFPTLEEGSPLVVYEAMSAGLACVLSPMGAGEVGRPGRDCLVVDPADEEGWVGAIRSVVGDAALRERLGREARERAREFTWDRVALRRRAQLEEARSAGRSAP